MKYFCIYRWSLIIHRFYICILWVPWSCTGPNSAPPDPFEGEISCTPVKRALRSLQRQCLSTYCFCRLQTGTYCWKNTTSGLWRETESDILGFCGLVCFINYLENISQRNVNIIYKCKVTSFTLAKKNPPYYTKRPPYLQILYLQIHLLANHVYPLAWPCKCPLQR